MFTNKVDFLIILECTCNQTWCHTYHGLLIHVRDSAFDHNCIVYILFFLFRRINSLKVNRKKTNNTTDIHQRDGKMATILRGKMSEGTFTSASNGMHSEPMFRLG